MNVLERAQQVVSEDRMMEHGHPLPNLQRTAQMWSAILGCPVSVEQVSLCQIAHKISRFLEKGHDDNLVDIAGYARVIEMCQVPPGK